MKLHKYLSVYLLVSYLSYLFIRQPQLSDSFIIIALCALFGFERYINRLESNDPKSSPEAKELREKLELDQLEATIERLKMDRQLQKARTDAMNAGGANDQKIFKF